MFLAARGRLAGLIVLAITAALVARADTGVAPPPSAAPPDDGQWTMPAKNYASTRYSELREIDTGNVAKLQVAFTFSLGVDRGQESAPIVVDNTLYVVAPLHLFVTMAHMGLLGTLISVARD